MKKRIQSSTSFIAALIVLFLLSFHLDAQIEIFSDDYPSRVGTFIMTEDNRIDSVIVNVGLAGENQTWQFDQEYASEFYRQFIVPTSGAKFSHFFPGAETATRYAGKLGSLIHSYYFDDAEGVFHLFYEKDNDQIVVAGIGVDSAKVKFQSFSFYYSGQIDIEPNLVLYNFPIQFNDAWETVSEFSIEVDTTAEEERMTLTAQVQDSIHNVVDGWGTIVLPDSTYECLRIKSCITLNEKLFFNGHQIRSMTTRTINYYWMAKEYGVVAKITSHSNESDENFEFAKKVYRLHKFNPQLEFAIADTSCEIGDILDIPVFIVSAR